jgi:hypothetical protein
METVAVEEKHLKTIRVPVKIRKVVVDDHCECKKREHRHIIEKGQDCFGEHSHKNLDGVSGL